MKTWEIDEITNRCTGFLMILPFESVRQKVIKALRRLGIEEIK